MANGRLFSIGSDGMVMIESQLALIRREALASVHLLDAYGLVFWSFPSSFESAAMQKGSRSAVQCAEKVSVTVNEAIGTNEYTLSILLLGRTSMSQKKYGISELCTKTGERTTLDAMPHWRMKL